jgi:hypothetical protein
LNQSRSHKENHCDCGQSHNNPLVHGICLFRHKIFGVLFGAPTFTSAHIKSPLFLRLKTTIFEGERGFFMDKTTLNKLKNKAAGFASGALTRVELVAEENRLKQKFQALGQKLYSAVQGDLLNAMKDDPLVVALLGEIEETKKKIADLENKIEGKGPEAK